MATKGFAMVHTSFQIKHIILCHKNVTANAKSVLSVLGAGIKTGDELEIKAEVIDIESTDTNTYYTLSTLSIGGVGTEQKLRLRQKEPLDIDIGDGIELVGDIKQIGQDTQSHKFYKAKEIFEELSLLEICDIYILTN